MPFPLALLVAFAIANSAAQYTLQSNFSGLTFFDNFDFWNSWDPTFGFVHYVDRSTAQAFGMINVSANGPATFGVEHTQILDPAANLGRASLRLTSQQSWTHGLFILDLAHMPATACGTWPAFWTLGSGSSNWPAYGEIDIIEYVNLKPNNSMALHTSENCTIAGSGQSGRLLTNDCGKDLGVAGCYVTPNKLDSAGTNFNDIGGGVYAMDWTSVAIRIWYFPRGAIPASVTSPNPNPELFGEPDANFEGSCSIDEYFFNHSVIFNTEFCGSWAGPTFIDDGCPALNASNQWSSCNEYVAANPQAFADSYWAVNYLHVYTTEAGTPPPASSPLASVIPAASTTFVTASGAEGRSTTPSGTLAPPSTSSPLSSSSPSLSSTTSSTTTPPPPPPPTSSPPSATSIVSTIASSSMTTTSPTSAPPPSPPPLLGTPSSTTASLSQSPIDGPVVIETTTDVVVWVTTTVTEAVTLMVEDGVTELLEASAMPSSGVPYVLLGGNGLVLEG